MTAPNWVATSTPAPLPVKLAPRRNGPAGGRRHRNTHSTHVMHTLFKGNLRNHLGVDSAPFAHVAFPCHADIQPLTGPVA